MGVSIETGAWLTQCSLQTIFSTNDTLKKRVESVLDMAVTTVTSLAESFTSAEPLTVDSESDPALAEKEKGEKRGNDGVIVPNSAIMAPPSEEEEIAAAKAAMAKRKEEEEKAAKEKEKEGSDAGSDAGDGMLEVHV